MAAWFYSPVIDYYKVKFYPWILCKQGKRHLQRMPYPAVYLLGRRKHISTRGTTGISVLICPSSISITAHRVFKKLDGIPAVERHFSQKSFFFFLYYPYCISWVRDIYIYITVMMYSTIFQKNVSVVLKILITVYLKPNVLDKRL